MMATATLRRIGLVAVLALILPAVFGFRAAALVPGPAETSTASLTDGREVLPGSADLGLRVSAGLQPVDAVLVNFPTAFNGMATAPGVTAPDGWEVTRISDGTDQALFFHGGTIAAGSSADFAFPAGVAAPQSGDLTGTFRVQVSSDAGRTFRNAKAASAGALDSTVKVLEVVGLDVVGDPLVSDGTGTSGQSVVARMQVKNHALGTVSGITGDFESTGDDAAASGQPISLAGGQTGAIDFDVTLGSAPQDGQRAATFTGVVTGPYTDHRSGEGDTSTTPYTIQAPPRLIATGIAPEYVAVGSPATIDLTVDKAGIPALTITDAGTLSFADTAATPVAGYQGDFTENGVAGQSLRYRTADVQGSDGSYAPGVSLAGVDGNGFALSVTPEDLGDLELILDSLAPVLTIDDVTLPDGQTAVKDDDRIEITASVDEANPWRVGFFRLDVGGTTIEADTSVSGDTITAVVEGVAFPSGATSFSIEAQVVDEAGFTGGAAKGSYEIDNQAPVMRTTAELLPNDQVPFGGGGDQVPATIEVRFTEAPALSNALDAAHDDDRDDNVRGGCSPEAWQVSGGHPVVEVRYSDGSACAQGQPGPDNIRLLVLGTPVDRDAADLSVTYTPPTLTAGISDDARNVATERVADVVSGIAPLAPEIVEVFRDTAGKGDCSGGDCEDAWGEDTDGDDIQDHYRTRFDGSDLLVDFAGARAGYTIQVLRDGSVVSSQDASAGLVRVPLTSVGAGTEREFAVGLRFLNDDGKVGELFDLTVTVDKVLPGLADITFGDVDAFGGQSATVAFSEPIVEGTDFAIDWRMIERTGTGAEFSYAPDEVSGSGEIRQLDFTPTGFSGTTMAGAKYELRFGEVYRDRAGNGLPNPAWIHAAS